MKNIFYGTWHVSFTQTLGLEFFYFYYTHFLFFNLESKYVPHSRAYPPLHPLCYTRTVVTRAHCVREDGGGRRRPCMTRYYYYYYYLTTETIIIMILRRVHDDGRVIGRPHRPYATAVGPTNWNFHRKRASLAAAATNPSIQRSMMINRSMDVVASSRDDCITPVSHTSRRDAPTRALRATVDCR